MKMKGLKEQNNKIYSMPNQFQETDCDCLIASPSTFF